MRKNTKEIEMTSGSLWDKILRFALPLAATGILQQLFTAADVAVVGGFPGQAGPAAMAAVGANSSLIGLIINLFIGMSLGTNVVIATAVGRGDRSRIRKAVHSSLFFALACGIVILVLSELLAGPIFSLLGVPSDVLPMAVLYFRIYTAGVPVIFFYNFEAAVFRAMGDTKTPLKVLTVSGALNVVLNLVFVIGLGRTVDGVALATGLSNILSAFVLLRRLMRSSTAAAGYLSDILRPGFHVLRHILRIGVPAGGQGAVFSFANIIIQTAINSLGTVIMAASSAAFNIEAVAYLTLNSFSQAATTFTGQNFGAGKVSRCTKSLYLCLLEGIAATALMCGLILLDGHQILALFSTDPEVIEAGYLRLLLIFSSYIFTISYETMSGYMRGFGISLLPALLSIVSVCGVRIAWIAFVFPHFQTFRSILLIYPISLFAAAALVFAALMRERPAKKLFAAS